MARVTIEIKGKTSRIAVDGVKGPGCLELSDALSRRAGTVKDVERTSEFFEDQEVEQEIG